MAEIYVRGENTRNWKARSDPRQDLLAAIERGGAEWENDPAYRGVLDKLGEVEQELAWTDASPGRRAALDKA